MKKIVTLITLILLSSSVCAQELSEPDAVILTKSLSDLPGDIVKETILGKVFKPEQLFVYEEEPTFLELRGFLKRLAFEQKLSLTENILTYFLNTEAEVAMWKDDSGRLENFLVVFNINTLKKVFLDFFLGVASLANDSQVVVSSDEGEKNISINLGSKKIYLKMDKDYLLVSSFSNGTSIKELATLSQTTGKSLYGKSFDSGIYTSIIGYELEKRKHILYVDGKFITFNFQYFIPSLRGITATFEDDKWKYFSSSNKNNLSPVVKVSEIWSAAPRSPAICFALPVDVDKISKMLTVTSVEKDKNNREVEIKKAEFNDDEVKALASSPVGICWYANSHILTPLLLMKPNPLKEMEARLTKVFSNYVGMYEYEDKDGLHKFPVETEKENGHIIISRGVSAPTGTYKTPDIAPRFKYSRHYKVKLLYKSGYLAFSADDKLIKDVQSVLDKKSPSLFDEMKGDKELNLIFHPQRLGSLGLSYVDHVLERAPDAVFKTTVSKYFENTLDNLKTVSPFGFKLPTESNDKNLVWIEISTINL